MRIALDDSDTALPGLHDKDERRSLITEEMAAKYMPQELDELFSLWTSHAMLGISLGTIMSTHYRARTSRPTKEELEMNENAIRALQVNEPANMNQSRVIASHYQQYKLYFEYVEEHRFRCGARADSASGQRSLYCIGHTYFKHPTSCRKSNKGLGRLLPAKRQGQQPPMPLTQWPR